MMTSGGSVKYKGSVDCFVQVLKKVKSEVLL